MKIKQWGAMALAVVMSLSLAACGSTTTEETTTEIASSEANAEDSTTATSEEEAVDVEEAQTAPNGDISLGMITDVGGINDLSFNQGSWEGMERAEQELGAKISYLESKTEADYAANFETMIDQENDVIFGVGFKLAADIQTAAETYDDQQFVILDASFAPEDVPNNNLTGVMFKNNDCSYLVGYIAGKMTQTGKVGFVSGQDSPVMNEFGYGYYAGVLAANPEAEVFGQYADAFNDPAKGKSIANQMYADGVDIIFACAGDTGNGVIEAAKEKDKWVIGVDRDQNYLAPENVLTSAIKRVDVAVFEVAKSVSEGTYVGGETLYYGLAEGGVDIAPTSDKNVTPEVLAEVEEMKAKIISGEIVVPNTAEEFAAAYPNVKFM